MAWEAIFEFLADNPPSIAIAGGVLLYLVSVFTAPFDSASTEALRSVGVLLIILGFILQLVWLLKDKLD